MLHVCAGAIEAQDPWAAATLQWLLARPDQVVQALLDAPEPPADHASASSSTQGLNRPHAALPPQLLLLDFLFYATASRAAALPLGRDAAGGTLRTLCHLAQRSAGALDARGLPELALVLLALLEAWAPAAAGEGSAPEEACSITGAWKEELAAAALLRASLGALSCNTGLFVEIRVSLRHCFNLQYKQTFLMLPLEQSYSCQHVVRLRSVLPCTTT